MIFSLAVYSPPSQQSSRSALKFASAALAGGHSIYRVFFYADGVYAANSQLAPPQDEPSIAEEWKTLAEQHSIDMVVCVAAALRRGMLDEAEALRHNKSAGVINTPFALSGLGQLVDASIQSDRLITFG